MYTHNRKMNGSGLLLRGFLIPIINTIVIELSTAAYLSYSFFPHLILRLNLLRLQSKSYQICNGTKDRLVDRCKQRFLVVQLVLGKLLEW